MAVSAEEILLRANVVVDGIFLFIKLQVQDVKNLSKKALWKIRFDISRPDHYSNL